LGVTDPEGTSAVSFVEPLIQACVKELTVFNRDGTIGMLADVRVDTGVFGKVNDFSAEVHCACSFMVNGVENTFSKVVIACSQMLDSSFQESWMMSVHVRSIFCQLSNRSSPASEWSKNILPSVDLRRMLVIDTMTSLSGALLIVFLSLYEYF